MTSRIALVVPEYRTEVAKGGGVATVADFVYAALSSEPDWMVELVSPRMSRHAPESQRIVDPKSLFRGPQVRVREVNGVPVRYVGSRVAEIESLRYRSRRVLRELLADFDLVLIVSGTPAAFETVRGVQSPILAQVATTVRVERTQLVKQGNLLRRVFARVNCLLTYRLDRRGVRIPNLILAENPWMEQWCRAQGASDVRIELPGIDTDFFSPCGDYSESRDAAYIVSVGRLDDPRKNFGLLIRAYAHAIQMHGIHQRLLIAGRNDLPADVYRSLAQFDLGSRVDVRNNLSPDELRAAYRGADLFAMSSSEEGLGLVLVESLACGTPIVTTATEGAKSIVGATGTGVLVEFGESVETELGDAIAFLAGDAEGRPLRSEQARQAAVTHFSLQKTGERFRNAVASLL